MTASTHRQEFYPSVLDVADRSLFATAREVEGLDDEIALLRVEIRRLVSETEVDQRLLQGAIRLLVQATAARHRLTGEQADSLAGAAAQLIEEVGAIFAGERSADDG
jgi:hypothetical protein